MTIAASPLRLCNNARAALNFLNAHPRDLGEVREAISCVVGDADRAAVIIDRIRDHVKKAPLRKDRFDLNEAIDEVFGLARGEITKSGLSKSLAAGLLPVHGDRVQLQQVVLNLILNAVEAMSLVDDRVRELSIDSERGRAGRPGGVTAAESTRTAKLYPCLPLAF
jgi:C4-dicarboxylate-specific signal transduction histidine kinase